MIQYSPSFIRNLALEAHTCNPSYSGGRDQEEHGSNTAQFQNPPQKGLVKWLKW
jgi:hypothetical protein